MLLVFGALLFAPTEALRLTPRCSTYGAVPWVAGCVAGGTLGVPFVSRAVKTWYSDGSLVKPKWTPPDKIFAPTWTLLYACIGLSAYRASPLVDMTLAYAHYALNLVWAPIFFRLRWLKLGALVNVALLASLFKIMPTFATAHPSTTPLLAPYAAWLAFATALNIQICRLNPKGPTSNNKAT